MDVLSGLEYKRPARQPYIPFLKRPQTISSYICWRQQSPGSGDVSWSSIRPSPGSTLLALPLEILTMTCLEVVCVGIIHPYDDEIRQDLPSLALLRACRELYLIAEPLIYDNTFRFCTPEALKSFLETGFHSPARRMQLKKIEVCFQWVSPTEEQAQQLYQDAEERRLDEDLSGSLGTRRAGRSKHLHHLRKIFYREEVWQPMMDLVLEHLRPEYLIIDLSDCTDLPNCCWLQSMAITTLRPGFRDGYVPRILKIQGYNGVGEIEGMTMVDHLVLNLVRGWTAKRAGIEGDDIPKSCNNLLKEAEKALQEESIKEENHKHDVWRTFG